MQRPAFVSTHHCRLGCDQFTAKSLRENGLGYLLSARLGGRDPNVDGVCQAEQRMNSPHDLELLIDRRQRNNMTRYVLRMHVSNEAAGVQAVDEGSKELRLEIEK